MKSDLRKPSESTVFGACGEIVRMLSAGAIALSFDARILSEYKEVLRRPRFGFEEQKIAALLDYIVYRGRAVAPTPLSQSLPDPDDEPFLEIALASQASCLVAGNQKHFPAEQCPGAGIILSNAFLIFFRNQQDKQRRTTKLLTQAAQKTARRLAFQ